MLEGLKDSSGAGMIDKEILNCTIQNCVSYFFSPFVVFHLRNCSFKNKRPEDLVDLKRKESVSFDVMLIENEASLLLPCPLNRCWPLYRPLKGKIGDKWKRFLA